MLESTLPSLFTVSLFNRLFGDEATTSVVEMGQLMRGFLLWWKG